MELLKQQHAQTAVEPVGPVELAGMEAVFATNAAIGVRVISAIGDTSYANEHPVIDLLRKEYQDIEPELL
jgi:branched-subunit amino acid aminotransferase/4-amino-4-deoxychorismate lyase